MIQQQKRGSLPKGYRPEPRIVEIRPEEHSKVTSDGIAITEDAHQKYLMYKSKHEEYSRLLKEGPYGKEKHREKGRHGKHAHQKDKKHGLHIFSGSSDGGSSRSSSSSLETSRPDSSKASSSVSSSSHGDHHRPKHRSNPPDYRREAMLRAGLGAQIGRASC